MMNYNIYFGTIGKTLGVKYRFTKKCNTEAEANKAAEMGITKLFYKNEGKYGIPTYETIEKESEITGKSIETLYDDHIKDLCRWYIIPTNLDTVPSKKIKFECN